MVMYPCRACAERLILPLLPTTPQNVTQICQPQLCTAQVASRERSLERYILQTFSAKHIRDGRLCTPRADTLRNSAASTSRLDLNGSRVQRGRQCVACDALYGAGGTSAPHSGSRSNSNSRRPSRSNQRGSHSAVDTPDHVCKRQLNPCGDSAHPAHHCPCLTTCRQWGQKEPPCKPLSASFGGEESSARCNRRSSCALSHISSCNRRRQCYCTGGRAPQETTEDPEAECDNCSAEGSWEKLSDEASPKRTPPKRGQFCSVNVGSGDTDETIAEDGEATLRWSLRNVRVEAARTRRVLEGCKSQLLARNEKLKPFTKSPRPPRRQKSVPGSSRTCLAKRDDGRNARAAPHAMAAPRDAAAATAVENQQGQQQQPQKQQELIDVLFQRKFEKEMQAFRRRLTDVTGSLNDKLSQILERETQLKRTTQELLKERENSSRLRRVYLEATKKNTQLATRNTSLERALLDVELKLCRPYKVWKLLGCPAAAVLQKELQRKTQECEDCTTASEGTAAYNAAPTRKRVCGPDLPSAVGTTTGYKSNREDKCPKHHANTSLGENIRASAGKDIPSRPNNKSRWSEDRLFRSVPCCLPPSEDTQGGSLEEREYDEEDYSQTQQRMSEKIEIGAPSVVRRTISRERDDNDRNMQQTAEVASSPKIRRRTPRDRVGNGEDRASSSATAAETQLKQGRRRTETGETLKTRGKKDAEKSVCLTQRLCRALHRSKTIGDFSQKLSSSPAAPNPGLDSACAACKENSCRGPPRGATSPKTSTCDRNPRVKKSTSLCISNPHSVCKEDIPEHHRITRSSSTPPSPREGMKTSLPARCFQSTTPPSGTPYSSPPSCLSPVAANKGERQHLQKFEDSADSNKRCCSASPSRFPRSSPFQSVSHDMCGKTLALSGSTVRQICPDEPCCYGGLEGSLPCESSSSIHNAPCPRGHSSLLPNHSGRHSTSAGRRISRAGCCDCTARELAADSPGTSRRVEETQARDSHSISMTSGVESGPRDHLPRMPGYSHAYCAASSGASQSSSETAARVPEKDSLTPDATRNSLNTMTASETSYALVGAAAPPCCLAGSLLTQNQPVLPTAEASSSTPCQSSDSVATAAGPPKSSPLIAAPTTRQNSGPPPGQDFYSCPSPKAFLDAQLSNDVACAGRTYTSSSSSSSSTPSGSTRVDVALQRASHSDASRSARSSLPPHVASASFNDSCESRNRSSVHSDRLDINTNANSSRRCSCCCLPDSAASVRQPELAGSATRCTTGSAHFSPLVCRSDAHPLLTENENMESRRWNSDQAHHGCRCSSSEAHCACDSAIRGSITRASVVSSVAHEKHRRPLLNGCVNSSCSGVREDAHTNSVCSASSSSASIFNSSSSVLPCAPLAVSSSFSESGFPGSSSTPALCFSANAPSSSGSSFTRVAEGVSEEQPGTIMPSCPEPSDTCGRKCCNALDGCVSWRLPHTLAVRGLPDACV